jgi:glycosyltransferase A (GT-A) superfamily protein (DUF2064 family)
MNGGVAIFVKTPGLSPVKTRLAAGIGAAAAERWHRLAADAVAEVAMSMSGLTAYWAVAEDLDRAGDAWLELALLAQGEGELGARMGRVHAELLARHDFALLLGADTPQLDPAHLVEAMDWLGSPLPRLVMGPARDGGFWLLGGNRSPQPSDWIQTPCGRADTARGFREAMRRHGALLQLPLLTDVDEAGDFDAMLAEFERLARPWPKQLRMAEWTREARAAAR